MRVYGVRWDEVDLLPYWLFELLTAEIDKNPGR